MGFFDLFNKLLISKELKIEEGKLIIYDSTYVMLPYEIIAELMKTSLKNPKMVSTIYYEAKEGTKNGFAKKMHERLHI